MIINISTANIDVLLIFSPPQCLSKSFKGIDLSFRQESTITVRCSSVISNIVGHVPSPEGGAIETLTRLVKATSSFLFERISRCAVECNNRALLSSYSSNGTLVRRPCRRTLRCGELFLQAKTGRHTHELTQYFQFLLIFVFSSSSIVIIIITILVTVSLLHRNINFDCTCFFC